MVVSRRLERDRRDYVSSPMSGNDDSGIDIFAAVPSHLHVNCVIPQSLDDQWIPESLVRHLLIERQSFDDVRDRHQIMIRSEYVRALLTSRQVVVNRTYLFRNPVISSDYTQGGDNREAFEQLLSQRALVPFLLKETSPLATSDAGDPRFADASRAWNAICRQRPLYCVRLSWDDEKNDSLVDKLLFRAFADGVRNASAANIVEFLEDHPWANPSRRTEDLRSRLTELQLIRRSLAAVPLTRTSLYEKFVVVDGTKAADRLYDPDKPFVGAIKSFLDLLYNSNLANALGKALVTPTETLHRSALLEHPSGPVNMRWDAPAIMEVVQNALFTWNSKTEALRPFEGLTLAQVLGIRQSQTWIDYADALDDLLRHPWKASHPDRGIPIMYKKYRALLDQAVKSRLD